MNPPSKNIYRRNLRKRPRFLCGGGGGGGGGGDGGELAVLGLDKDEEGVIGGCAGMASWDWVGGEGGCAGVASRGWVGGRVVGGEV